MKKLLAIILIISMCAANCYAASTSTLAVGNKTANYAEISSEFDVYVTLAEDSVNKDMSFREHIQKATEKFGKSPSLSINGTYFNAYYKAKEELSFPSNCAAIQQTIMIDGRVVVGGGDGKYGTLGITSDGKALIDKVEIKPYLVVGKDSSQKYYFWGVNKDYTNQSCGVCLFTYEVGYPVNIPENNTVLVIKNGKVESILNGGYTATIEAGTQLAVFGNDIWANSIKWNPKLCQGESAEIFNEINVTNGNPTEWSKVITAIAANPWILSNGNDVTADNNITEEKLSSTKVLQRSFAGLKTDGRLVFGTVVASPMNLANSLKNIGVMDAVLLDGGGSSAMAVNGKIVTNAGRKLANVIHFAEKPELPFTDVASDAYYKNAVKWAYNNGITSGIETNLFGSNSSCTRAQVVTFIWRAAGKPEPSSNKNPFTDVKESDFFYKPVLWAVEKGITSGTEDGVFSPNDSCSNAHIITFIWRALGQPEKTGQGQWYDDAKNWADKNGLLTGTYTKSFNLEEDCVRANVVEYLYRYYSK